MEHDPKTPQYQTSDKTSFAYITVRDRWPTILTQALDDVFRATRNASDATTISEGKHIVEQCAKLKYEVQHDRELTPLEPDDDEGADIAAYNTELAALGHPKWFAVPWLFAECYLYRRLRGFFARTTMWKTYDPFRAQKEDTFRSSATAVFELAAHYDSLVNNAEGADEEKEKLVFEEVLEISLWGNATDLSLLTSLSYADIQTLQGAAARKKAAANILVNDLPAVWDVLSRARAQGKETRRVDIVLDNSGFELFADLVLAGYLLSSNLATHVVLHPKTMPWFVSDVTPPDFGALLTALHDPATFFSSMPLTPTQLSHLSALSDHWTSLHTCGRLILRSHAFWTTAHSYWRTPHVAQDLWNDLQDAEMVVFKGDLNYRKLTADAVWAPTTAWRDAIGPFGEDGCGIRTLALRTCKADVVVGLPEGRDEELRGTQEEGEEGKRQWAWSGKWAMVQFWDGNV